MSYHLRAGEPVEAELRRLAADQLGRALRELDEPELGRDETVHQVRKRCKKLRGLLRLVRPAMREKSYQRENRALRDAQRLLSPLRDAHARLEALASLRDAFEASLDAEALAPVREAFVARSESVDPAQCAGCLERFRAALEDVRARSQEWELEADGFDAVEGGLAKTYRRGRKAMRRAYRKGSADAFHEWRKRVKYHLYHVRLLREAWPSALGARRGALERLADRLGDAHDLAVLTADLDARPVAGLRPSVEVALRGLLAARRGQLRREARPIGRRLYAEAPDAFVERLGVWFDVSEGEARAASSPAARGSVVAPGPRSTGVADEAP